jgi:hypothetical protein
MTTGGDPRLSTVSDLCEEEKFELVGLLARGQRVDAVGHHRRLQLRRAPRQTRQLRRHHTPPNTSVPIRTTKRTKPDTVRS